MRPAVGMLDGLLHVSLGLLSVAQPIVDLTAQLVEGRILRIVLDQRSEVCQRFLEPAQSEQDLRAAEADQVPARVGIEDLGEIVDGLLEPAELERQLTFHDAGVDVVGGARQIRLAGSLAPPSVVRIAVGLGQQEQGIGVIGLEPQAPLEIGDRFGPLLLLGEQPAAVNQGFGIVRLGGELAVQLGQFGGAPRLRARSTSPTTRTGLGGGTWPAALLTEAAGYGGASQSSPSGASWSRIRRRSQTSTVFSSVAGDQLRAVGAKGERRRGHRLQRRQPGKLPPGGGVGQQDLVGAIPRAISRPSAVNAGAKDAAPVALLVRSGDQVPTSRRARSGRDLPRIGCVLETSQRPSGLKPAAELRVADRRLSASRLRSSRRRCRSQTRTPDFLPAANRQPAAIRADGDRDHAAILAAVEAVPGSRAGGDGWNR